MSWVQGLQRRPGYTCSLADATKKLSTGTNWQKEDALSHFCPRSFDPAVMAISDWSPQEGRAASDLEVAANMYLVTQLDSEISRRDLGSLYLG